MLQINKFKLAVRSVKVKENSYFDHKAYRNLCFSSDDIPKIGEIFQRKLTEVSEKDYDLHSHPKVKEFREKVWNIHHQGQPMPTAETQQGLEDEDIIMSQVRNRAMCILISPPPHPHRQDWNFLGMGGSLRPKKLKKCIKLDWNFSNSLIIHQVKTKKITSVKEVWMPGLN